MSAKPTLLARALRVMGLQRAASAPRGRSYYGAAQSSRLTDDWLSTLIDPANETKASAATLRGRVRDLRRNNPLVARIADVSVDHIIGPDGITLQATPGNTRGSVNDNLATACERVFYEWAPRAALTGQTWDAVARQLVEAWAIEGEVFLELVSDDRLPLGLGVQAIDADLLDSGLNQPRGGGRREIVQGVQLNDLGAPEGYWLWTSHPSGPGRKERRFVPADRLLHLAHRPRVGQVRGITPLAPAMLRLQMLNGTQEALVMLHRAAANKGGFFTSELDADGLQDEDGAAIQFEASPLSIESLPAGVKFTPWDPGQPTQQYDPFQKSLKAEIAVSIGMSYMTLTGDMSETSFSSGRLGIESERERWKTKQAEFAAVICQPVYAAVLRAARMRGVLQRPADIPLDRLTSAVWHGRRWGYVDPAKDVAAIQQKLASGLTTVTRELNALGLDIADVFAERAKELALAKSLGIPLLESPAPAAPDEDETPAKFPSIKKVA